MDQPRHYFGDKCNAPHGGDDAPREWANHPDEPIDLVRRRYGKAAGPGRAQPWNANGPRRLVGGQP